MTISGSYSISFSALVQFAEIGKTLLVKKILNFSFNSINALVFYARI